MKTGNGATPNPKGIWNKGFARDTSNESKGSTGGAFSAKKDSYKGKGKSKRGK